MKSIHNHSITFNLPLAVVSVVYRYDIADNKLNYSQLKDGFNIILYTTRVL